MSLYRLFTKFTDSSKPFTFSSYLGFLWIPQYSEINLNSPFTSSLEILWSSTTSVSPLRFTSLIRFVPDYQISISSLLLDSLSWVSCQHLKITLPRLYHFSLKILLLFSYWHYLYYIINLPAIKCIIVPLLSFGSILSCL